MTKAMGKRSVNWFRMRYEQRRRKNTTARWSARTSKEPGPDGSTKSLARSPLCIKFLIQSVYDVLHSPSNLYTPPLHTPKQVVLQERTVPWEDQMEEAPECKNSSQSAGIMGGEHAVSQSELLQQTIKTFGVKGLQCRRAIKNILEA